MRKIFVTIGVVVAASLLGGCTYDEKAKSIDFPFNEDFKDCKAGNFRNSNGVAITAVRCPNSTTTASYQVGKTTQSTVVTDQLQPVSNSQQPKKNSFRIHQDENTGDFVVTTDE